MNEPLSIGGVFLFLNYILIFILDLNLNFLTTFSFKEKVLIFIYCSSIFFIGLFDDLLELSPWRRIALISLFSYFFLIELNLLISHIYIDFFELEIYLGNFAILFTILTILTLINFNNMYDGINGQSCFYYIILFSYLISKNLGETYLLFLLVFLIFFSVYNLRNKIYLGDSGIYLISMIISVFFIFGFKNKVVFLSEMLCLFFIPFIDMVRLIITRLLLYKHPFSKDTNHYHHILSRKFKKIYVILILHLPPLVSICLINVGYNYFFPIMLFNLGIYSGFYFILNKVN